MCQCHLPASILDRNSGNADLPRLEQILRQRLLLKFLPFKMDILVILKNCLEISVLVSEVLSKKLDISTVKIAWDDRNKIVPRRKIFYPSCYEVDVDQQLDGLFRSPRSSHEIRPLCDSLENFNIHILISPSLDTAGDEINTGHT